MCLRVVCCVLCVVCTNKKKLFRPLSLSSTFFRWSLSSTERLRSTMHKSRRRHPPTHPPSPPQYSSHSPSPSNSNRTHSNRTPSQTSTPRSPSRSPSPPPPQHRRRQRPQIQRPRHSSQQRHQHRHHQPSSPHMQPPSHYPHHSSNQWQPDENTQSEDENHDNQQPQHHHHHHYQHQQHQQQQHHHRHHHQQNHYNVGDVDSPPYNAYHETPISPQQHSHHHHTDNTPDSQHTPHSPPSYPHSPNYHSSSRNQFVEYNNNNSSNQYHRSHNIDYSNNNQYQRSHIDYTNQNHYQRSYPTGRYQVHRSQRHQRQQHQQNQHHQQHQHQQHYQHHPHHSQNAPPHQLDSDDDDQPLHPEEDGAITQSESDEPRDRDPSDGGLTEEESNPSPPPPPEPRRSPPRRKQRRQPQKLKRTFSWSNYPRIVYLTSEMCRINNVDPASIAYARILGTGKGSVDYYVRSHSITIGRWGYGTDCQIKSETRSISRKHAKLYWDAALDNWMLSCLSSKNGMIVDGAPIAPYGVAVPLKSRTLVEIGDIAFYFLAAAEHVFRVNDVTLLERTIGEARIAYENDLRIEAMNGAQDQMDEDEVQPDIKPNSRSDRPSSKRSKPSDAKKGQDSSRRGSRTPSAVAKPEPESDSSVSDDDELVVPDILDDPKYRLPSMESDSKKRKSEQGGGSKKRRKKDRTYDHANFEELNYTGEWNKKEKADFTRALFAVGIDADYDSDNNVVGFNWHRFRRIADFPKKSDQMLEEHYRRLMTDVHELLDGEEREKKAKMIRSRHGSDCECSVCKSQKSGKRKRDDDDNDMSDKEDGKGKERLMGLVTAQKLRVRIGILEAAKRVDTSLWDFAIVKLESTLQSSLREFPEWWHVGHHDRDLMRGVAKHGVGPWDDIWHDESLKSFAEEKYEYGDRVDELQWPSNQAAMKRVREIGSAMMYEMKRIAKRDAEEQRRKRKRDKKKDRKISKRSTGGRRGEDHSRGETENSRHDRSRSEYEDYPTEDQHEQHHHDYEYNDGEEPGENGESTADDSASENRNRVAHADEIETEEEEEEEEEIDGGRGEREEEEEQHMQQDESGYQEVDDENKGEGYYYNDQQHRQQEQREEWRYSEEEIDGGYATASDSE